MRQTAISTYLNIWLCDILLSLVSLVYVHFRLDHFLNRCMEKKQKKGGKEGNRENDKTKRVGEEKKGENLEEMGKNMK